MNFIPQAVGAAQGFFKGGGLGALISGTLKDAGKPETWETGMTALAAMSRFSAGLADKAEADASAAQNLLGARQEFLRGQQGGNEILDRMVDTLARNRVAFAASGTDASIGTPAAIQRDVRARGERAVGVVAGNAAIEWFSRREMAASLKARGKAYALGGFLDAGAELGRGAAAVARRG